MIVGICGFGSTGSGAVMDYLKEFAEISGGKNMELSFLYDPDGILDLEYRLINNPIRFYSGDVAIKNFKKLVNSYDLARYIKRFMSYQDFKRITEEFISEIIVMQWEGGLWHYDRRQSGRTAYFIKYWMGGKYLRIFDKLNKEQPQRFWNHRMYIPIHDNRFYNAVQKYTSSLLLSMCGETSKIIALDQPFPSNNPQCCFKFFNQSCKAIIVNRDPRDLYLISKVNSVGWEMRFTPTHSVEDFIIYYQDQMNIIQTNAPDILYIQFEDLIYNYDDTAKKINKFLNIENHIHPMEHFNPKISIANTQMILRFPQYTDDIKKIEASLPEYLYSFDESKADLKTKLWAFKDD